MPTDFLAGFDATKIDPGFTGEVWPLDWYKVVITDIEEKLNSSETGSYLLFQIKCIEGGFAGRESTFTLNVRNQNQQTVDIAYKQISAICRCTGVLHVQAKQQLYNIPFRIKIGPQKGNEMYSQIGGFQDANGNPPNKAGQPAVSPILPNSPQVSPVTAPAPPQQYTPPAGPQWVQQPAQPWGPQPPQQWQPPQQPQPWAQPPQVQYNAPPPPNSVPPPGQEQPSNPPVAAPLPAPPTAPAVPQQPWAQQPPSATPPWGAPKQ